MKKHMTKEQTHSFSIHSFSDCCLWTPGPSPGDSRTALQASIGGARENKERETEAGGKGERSRSKTAQKQNWFGPFRQTGKQTLSSWYQKHLWEIVLEPQTLKLEGFETPKILCLNICDVRIYP